MLKKSSDIFELSILTALCLALCVGTWASARHSEISSKLVRLHVLAVSDDEYEQAVKLKVRDSVLSYLSPLLDDADSQTKAREIISENLDGIARAAHKAADGRTVTVSLGRESYPTRQYEGFSLPAGEYSSLRVILGEGKGHNWWCVVFPPLCTSAVEGDRLQSVMGQTDYGIITEDDGYEIRFRVLELWGKIRNSLNVHI